MQRISSARRSSASLGQVLALIGGVACGVMGAATASHAEDAQANPKEQIVMLYMLKLAPAACKWEVVGDAAKLDAKIADGEKSLGITDEEKTKYRGLAEQNFKATSEDCDAKGMVRALYDEAVK